MQIVSSVLDNDTCLLLVHVTNIHFRYYNIAVIEMLSLSLARNRNQLQRA